METAGLPQETIEAVVLATQPVKPMQPENLPTDLVTLQEAADKLGIPYGRVKAWHARDYLTEYDRKRAPARGGGYVLVSMIEVAYLVENPLKKTGRPRKRPL